MIHECLFHILNNPDEDDYHSSRLFELENFMHPGEKQLIHIILEIAKDYHIIANFNKMVLNPLRNVQGAISFEKNQKQHGLYLTAFCNGVHKVLSDYREAVIDLETTFIRNPQLPLSYIRSTMETYKPLFKALLSMIYIIQNDNVFGCLLIGRLHKYVFTGVDQINKAAHEIIKAINTVFYRHLCNWIIYGEIADPFQEFFIRDEEIADENFLYPEQLSELLNETVTLNSKIRRPSIVRKFYINWEMVPIIISEDLIESILFMGRIVWIIRNGPKKNKNENYQIEYTRDIWQGEEFTYYKKIQALESQSSYNLQFQKTIEECRVKLTTHLWSIMLNEGNLVAHLHLIRDYYALGRGELFQQFIRVAEDHLKDTSSDLIVQHLNFIFFETARKIYGENDKTYLKFKLTSNSEVNRVDPWSSLQLNFEIDWPLHIVFHPKVIELYNKLFCFLLRLRKTQIDLHKLWAEHISAKKKIDPKWWTLRQNLMFLVNNLQYYLQVDVIEAHFSLLLKAVENANGFEDIIKVHHNFITNLLSKTFVSTTDKDKIQTNKHNLYQVPAVQCDTPNNVFQIILKLLTFSDNFCITAKIDDYDSTDNDIEELKQHFDLLIESLLNVIYKLYEKDSGQHLLQLLSQLDFNRYFSKNKSGDISFHTTI